MEYFGFGREVGALTVSLFITGYCLGPLVWGPLSEDVSFSKPLPSLTFTQFALQIGRRPVFLIAFLLNVVLRLLPSPIFTPDCSSHRHSVFKSAAPCRKTLRLF